jgi:hypothetical protein
MPMAEREYYAPGYEGAQRHENDNLAKATY